MESIVLTYVENVLMWLLVTMFMARALKDVNLVISALKNVINVRRIDI